MSFANQRKGFPLSRRTISRWVASSIEFCHERANKPLVSKVQAHSSRSMATSTALFNSVSLPDICRAATWLSIHTFTKHYCLDASFQEDAAVGQAVGRANCSGTNYIFTNFIVLFIVLYVRMFIFWSLELFTYCPPPSCYISYSYM